MPENIAITEQLAEIFVSQGLLEDAGEIRSDLDLTEDLGLDSFGFINLVMALNSAFLINIKSTEIIPENFSTVAKLEEFISEKKK